MVPNMCVNFGVQQSSGSRVRGQKGGQNGSSEEPFGYISNGFHYFWLIFRLRGALMVLNTCVNFGVHEKDLSRLSPFTYVSGTTRAPSSKKISPN